MASGYQNRGRSDPSRVSEYVSYGAREPFEERSHILSLTVLFTTVPGTLSAFREAARWAHQLGACIRVLVAQVVPYPLPIDKPRVDPEFRLRRFRAFCEQSPVETRIEIRLCREARQCIQDALLPHSLIVIGNRRSRWPWTYEKQLGRNLQKVGHQVILVGSPKAVQL